METWLKSSLNFGLVLQLPLQPCTHTTDLFSGQTVSSIIYLSCHFSHCRAPTVLTGALVAWSAVQPHFKELRCDALIQAPPEDGGGGGVGGGGGFESAGNFPFSVRRR